MWASNNVNYPVALAKLPADIAFEKSDYQILLSDGLIAAFGQVVSKTSKVMNVVYTGGI